MNKFSVKKEFCHAKELLESRRLRQELRCSIEVDTGIKTESKFTSLESWIRTTWMPFTQYIPENERGNFITDFALTYLEGIPLDQNGLAHVRMVRLVVNALKS